MKTSTLLEARTPAAADLMVAPRGRRRTGTTAGKVVPAVVMVFRFLGRIVIASLLAATVAVFLFLAVGPRFLNYQTSTMLTGSMSPLINPGDVVVSAKIPVSELQVGDIMTYSIPVGDRRIETHRVTGIKVGKAGETSVTTKGDANPGADPWTAILSEDHVYKNVAVVPYLGTGIRALREPPVQATLLYGAPAVLVLFAMKAIWSKPKDDDRTKQGSDDKDREVQQ